MENILLKISGESMKGEDSILSKSRIDELVAQIIKLKSKYNIGIVLGGGNIWRGEMAAKLNFTGAEYNAHMMGMMATIINSLALENALRHQGVDTKTFSSLNVPQACDNYTVRDAKIALANNTVCIFAGGTGGPFVTTDTAVSLRAAETGASYILMGKNGVDGVYDDDPMTNPNAKRFSKIDYQEVVNRNLKVMDLNAMTICRTNNIKIIVFKSQLEDGFNKAIDPNFKLKTIIG